MSALDHDRVREGPPTITTVAARPPSATERRLAKNTLAIGLSAVTTKGLMFLWQIMLARTLGAEGYGIYGTIGAMLAIGAAIPDLGMGLIVIRDVAKEPESAGRYLAATLSAQPLLAAAGYAALLLGAQLLGYDLEIRLLLAFVAVNLLVDVLGNMCHNQLVAAERMTTPAIISVAHVVVLVVLGGIALLAHGGLWGLYVATMIAGIGRSTTYWIALRRIGLHPVFPVDGQILRRLVLHGLPLASAAFLSLAGTHADKLMSTSLVGVESTGQLTAAFVIVFGVTELLSTPMLVATLPLLSRAGAEGTSGTLQLLTEKLSLFNLLLSLPVAVTVSILAIPLSRGVFGEAYLGTAAVLQVLLWYAVVAMAASVFAQVLMVQNHQGKVLAARAVGLMLNVALSLALIPRLGVMGVASAALLAEAVVLVLVGVAVRFHIGWWAHWAGRVARLGAATLVLAGWVLWLSSKLPWLAAVTALPVDLVLMRLFRVLVPEDRILISDTLRSMPWTAAVAGWWERKAA